MSYISTYLNVLSPSFNSKFYFYRKFRKQNYLNFSKFVNFEISRFEKITYYYYFNNFSPNNLFENINSSFFNFQIRKKKDLKILKDKSKMTVLNYSLHRNPKFIF